MDDWETGPERLVAQCLCIEDNHRGIVRPCCPLRIRPDSHGPAFRDYWLNLSSRYSLSYSPTVKRFTLQLRRSPLCGRFPLIGCV